MICDSGDPIEGQIGTNTKGDGNPQQSYAGDLDATPAPTATQFGLNIETTPGFGTIETIVGGQPVYTKYPLIAAPMDSFLFVNVGQVSNANPTTAFTNPPNLVATIYNQSEGPGGAYYLDPRSYGYNVAGNYFVNQLGCCVVETAGVLSPQFTGDPAYLKYEYLQAIVLPMYYAQAGAGVGAAIVTNIQSTPADPDIGNPQPQGNGVIGYQSNTPVKATCTIPVKPGVWQLTLQQTLNYPPLVDPNNVGPVGTVSVSGVVVAHFSQTGIPELGASGSPGFNLTNGSFNITVAKTGYLVVNLSGINYFGSAIATLTFLHA